MKLTFVDAGVLIAAARGGNLQAARAMEILDDPERELPQALSCASRFATILTIFNRHVLNR